jgi:hypothetical protein
MLPVLISCLFIGSALAASNDDCNVGNVTFTGFDIDKVRDSDLHHFQDSLKHDNVRKSHVATSLRLFFVLVDGFMYVLVISATIH